MWNRKYFLEIPRNNQGRIRIKSSASCGLQALYMIFRYLELKGRETFECSKVKLVFSFLHLENDSKNTRRMRNNSVFDKTRKHLEH